MEKQNIERTKVEREIAFEIKQFDEEQRSFWAVASTATPDRFGDVIKQDGWILDQFKKNPVIPWGHDYSKPPVARAEEIYVQDGKLVFLVKFPEPGTYDLADTVFELYKQGFLRAFSVGFMPLEYEFNENGGLTYSKQELLEISAVTVPANPEALMLAYKSILNKTVPPKHTPAIDSESSWDANKAIKQLREWASKDGSGDKDTIDWNKYAKGFGWYDGENKENFGSYKLPHHYVKDGQLITVWSGVKAAMAALLGARGGVDIPENEMEKVYNHLAGHYKQFDKEPPELRTIKFLSNVLSEVYSGIAKLQDDVKHLDILSQKIAKNQDAIAALVAKVENLSMKISKEETKKTIKNEIRRWLNDARKE